AGPKKLMTSLAVAYYRLAAKLPQRPGTALLSNGLIVRVMSMAMAKTRRRSLRRWIHDQHRRYFSVFSDRTRLLEAFQASVDHTVAEFAPDIAMPTLLIAADKDDIAPLR